MKRVTRQNMLTMAALILVFAGPMILAFYMYNNNVRWSNKTTNHGELIKPMIAIDSLKLSDEKQHMITSRDLHRKWWLMYVSDQPCQELCQENLYKMQQIRLALNAKQNKLQCFVVTPRTLQDSKLQEALKNTFTTIRRLFITEQNKTIQFQSLYIVDPLGNIMMRYTENAEPKDILKDLKHLISE